MRLTSLLDPNNNNSHSSYTRVPQVKRTQKNTKMLSVERHFIRQYAFQNLGAGMIT